MGISVLGLVQSACYEANAPAPTALIGSTDTLVLQYLNLTYNTCRELRSEMFWPQLKRFWSFTLQSGRAQYQLPGDYYSGIPQTQWDQQNRWEMTGPLTDREFNYRRYGYITIENKKAYRIWGPDANSASPGGQFYIDPVPNSNNVNAPMSYEYITKSMFLPANWAASIAYTTTNYVNNYGYIYKCSSNGTSAASIGPTLANGTAKDGGVFWLYVSFSNWASTTPYGLGDYVKNSGNYYICIGAGTSAGSGGPATTSASITDGTVIWQYLTVTAWAAETIYGQGAYVTSNSNLYFSTTIAAPSSAGITTAISGKIGPNFTATTQVDGGATWTWQQPGYETILADTDTCLFDDELVIAGLKWRFLRARGLQFQDEQQDYKDMIETAYNRWNPGKKISLGDGGDILSSGLYPRLPEGGFGS